MGTNLVGTMSPDLNISSLTEFATSLTTTAFTELNSGYHDLVRHLRGDSKLAALVDRHGIDNALIHDPPVLANFRKENKEFVTAAERQAERAMRERVNATYATHSIIGEELGITHGNEWLWVFDPVDGTSAMIRTAIATAYHVALPSPLPAFGTTIAVIHGEEAVIGVVAELRGNGDGLVMPRVWTGAQAQPTLQNGKSIKLTAEKLLKQATLASTIPEVMFTTPTSWGGFQALLDSTATFIPDQNCLGYMQLLTGAVDIVMERDLTLPDAAAFVPILTGANIRITDHDGQPIRFDAQAQEQEYLLLAAAPHLHDQALTTVRAGTPSAHNRFIPNSAPQLGYAQKFLDSEHTLNT